MEKVFDSATGNFYIVGIGASAGGLDAIQELFNNLPVTTGYGFVLIQHLSPDHKSLLREILSKHTSMQLFEAEDGVKVQPNCIYIIPNKKTMTIQDGMLVLKDKEANRGPNSAIDIFFESLAADQGSRAAGIILSGTGTDGSKGIEAIKRNGGMIIVQDPLTAAFDGMPNSAIQTGCADLILPPEMMGDELIEFLSEIPFLKGFNTLNKQEEVIFFNILDMVKRETGQDFSQYKTTTLSRRLAKKMFEKGITSISEYYTFLLNNLGEAHNLSKEFLINVTRFFRDTEAFEMLSAKALPSVFENKKAGDEVKMWVVACSTGQEAYSFAMLVHEFVESTLKLNFNIKIFATDIDQEALNVAVKGFYSAEEVKDLSAARLHKFFIKEGNGYQVIPGIRKMVVFAKHDVTKDPPFSKVDLLSCRNMLIYMTNNLQKSILRKLHFSLNENAFLFLGPSESPAVLLDYFKEIDRKWKLFKCIFKTKTYDYGRYFAPSSDGMALAGIAKSKNALNNIPEIFRETLQEEYNFTGILVDKDMQVKQAVGNFRNFMRFPENNFNLNIQKLLQPDLAVAVSMAVRKAIKDNERVSIKGIKVADGDVQRKVNVLVKPYVEQKEYLQPFLFIVIEEIGTEQAKPVPHLTADVVNSSSRIQELEAELREVKENLQAVVEEVESANEELQTSNEEIISTNEELQSTNEELQSLNEELHTVNAELQMKIKEQIEFNDDLNNYFNNSDIGQVLMDRNLVIRKFTPATTRQINLIPSDIGRSITDISTNFKRSNFVEDLRDVINTGRPFEKEIAMSDQNIFLMRIQPYLRQDKTIDGVVVNFIDISDLKRLNSMIQAVFNNSPNAIASLKAIKNRQGGITDFEFTVANKNAELLFSKGALIGKQLFTDAIGINYYFSQLVNVCNSGERFEVEYMDKKSQKWYGLIATRMLDGVVVTMTDVNDKRQASDLLRQSYDRLKLTSDELNRTIEKLEKSNLNLAQFASIASHDLKEPLRKIQLLGDLLRGKTYEKLEEHERDYIDKMIKSSTRLQKLIDNVMDFSRLTNDNIEKVQSDLNTIVLQILDDIELVVKEKHATVNIGDLPVINAKADQIRQLFQNLISNALKFTSNKPPVINIRAMNPGEASGVPIESPDKYVLIEVEDNGIGFDEQYSDKIFGLFQRLHGSEFSGTGIGLAICKKIVDEHDGFIKVKSKQGYGTKFVIGLPR